MGGAIGWNWPKVMNTGEMWLDGTFNNEELREVVVGTSNNEELREVVGG